MADPSWKRKGFKSYYEYRNYIAQLEGYKSFYFRRQARDAAKAGNYELLKGTDQEVYNPNFVKRAADKISSGAHSRLATGESVTGRIRTPSRYTSNSGGLPSPRSITDMKLTEYDQKADEIAKGLISRKKFDGEYPKVGRFAERSRAPMFRHIEEQMPWEAGANSKSFVRKAYARGAKDAGLPALNPSEEAMGVLNGISDGTRSLLTERVENWTESAHTFDNRAKIQMSEKEMKSFLKRNKVHAIDKRMPNSQGKIVRVRRSLSSVERYAYEDMMSHSYVLGLTEAYAKKGILFYEVSDGAGCGWSFHGDPDIAHGKVVSHKEAQQYPQAHPYCVRSFSPITDPKKAKELAEKSKQRSLSLKNIGKGGAAAGGAVALSYLALTASITTPNFSGTVGDLLLSGIADGMRFTFQNLMATNNRVIQAASQRFAALGYGHRLNQLVEELADDLPDLSLEDIKTSVMGNIREAADSFGSGTQKVENVISIATRRVIEPPGASQLGQTGTIGGRTVTQVDGDNLSKFQAWRTLQASNEVMNNTSGPTDWTRLLNNQSIVHQAIMDNTRYQGKFFRLTLPKINHIDGNTGKRITERYGRFSLSPNKFANAHVTVRKNADGSIRTVKNLRLNPNGLLRLGFVKDEKGIISPNLAIVPRGPIRIYSRANRSPATRKVTRTVEEWIPLKASQKQLLPEQVYVEVNKATGVETTLARPGADISGEIGDLVKKTTTWTEEIVNPAAGLVNSVTTEARLITRWVPFSERMWYKARVNTRALGIKNLDDLRNLTISDFRRWKIEGKNTTGGRYNWLSAGVELRAKGGNVFDFSRSLRIDPNTRLRVRNLERHLDDITGAMATDYKSLSVAAKGAIENPLSAVPEFGDLYQAGVRLTRHTVPVIRKFGEDLVGITAQTAVKEIPKLLVRSIVLKELPDLNVATKKYLSSVQSALSRRVNLKVLSDFSAREVLNSSETVSRIRYLWNDIDIKELDDSIEKIIAELEQIERGSSRAYALSDRSPWEYVQFQWAMVNKEVESRMEHLTDYLVLNRRRTGLATKLGDDVVFRSEKTLGIWEVDKLRLSEDTQEINKVFFEKPDIIVAIMEADPKRIADDLLARLPDMEELQAWVAVKAQEQFDFWKELAPDGVVTRLEARLARSETFNEFMAKQDSIRNVEQGNYRIVTPVRGGSTRDIPTPYSLDDEGNRFVGLHISTERDFVYNPDYKPVDVAFETTPDASLFTTFSPGSYEAYALREVIDGIDLDFIDDYVPTPKDLDKLYVHQIWVKDSQLKGFIPDDSSDFVVKRGRSVVVKGSRKYSEVRAEINEFGFQYLEGRVGLIGTGKDLADVIPSPGDIINYGQLPKTHLTTTPYKGRAKEIVEYVIDGPSKLLYRGDEAFMRGNWDVVGVHTLQRNRPAAALPFPDDVPDSVETVQRIVIRQKGFANDTTDLAASVSDEPILDLISHRARRDTLSSAFPAATDAASEFEAHTERLLAATRGRGDSVAQVARDRLMVAEVEQLMRNAPRSPNTYYRSFLGDSANDVLDLIAEDKPVLERFGIWSSSTDKFAKSGGPRGPRVVIAIRKARALNLEPFKARPSTGDSLDVVISGRYKFVSKYEDLTTNTTWVFVEQI